MTTIPKYPTKIGYTRKEFGAIFQLYSQNVYKGLFKDFSFLENKGKYYISFREEAGKTPLITIEKRCLGQDTILFTATTPAPKNQVVEIARSEKLESFIRQLGGKIEILRNLPKTGRNSQAGNYSQRGD